MVDGGMSAAAAGAAAAAAATAAAAAVAMGAGGSTAAGAAGAAAWQRQLRRKQPWRQQEQQRRQQQAAAAAGAAGAVAGAAAVAAAAPAAAAATAGAAGAAATGAAGAAAAHLARRVSQHLLELALAEGVPLQHLLRHHIQDLQRNRKGKERREAGRPSLHGSEGGRCEGGRMRGLGCGRAAPSSQLASEGCGGSEQRARDHQPASPHVGLQRLPGLAAAAAHLRLQARVPPDAHCVVHHDDAAWGRAWRDRKG